MGRRRRAKDGDQGRLQMSGEHHVIDHRGSEKYGQKNILEESTPQLQQSQSSGSSSLEHVLEKQETRPRLSMAQQGQQASDDRVRKTPSQNANEQSQNIQSAQINESQQPQLQSKANEPYTHSQPPVADFTEVQQREQFQPQGQIPALKTSHSQPHNSDLTQAHKRQLPQSQSTGNAIDSARDPSPKKGGVRSRMTKVIRDNFYPSSYEEKASSKPKHLRKGPNDGKRSENGSRDQRKPLPDPPTPHSTQSRADYSQPRPRTSQGQSEAQLTTQGSSQQTQVTPHRELGPLHIEAGDDYGSKRAIVSTSDEDVENHAWERHLLQSADDATIQTEVLTLFEFIEYHVEDYYCDSRVKISQAIVDQLTKVQSPHLPSEASLKDLLELARYQAPIIKHCLINLVVSGMSFQESVLFPLLPDEFTVLPRAIHKETVDPCKQLCRSEQNQHFPLMF